MSGQKLLTASLVLCLTAAGCKGIVSDIREIRNPFRRASAKADSTSIAIVARPSTASTNAFYVSNRPPLIPSPFIKLPIGAIEPAGWLRRQLELQAAGFHGHLTEISRFLKKDGNAWLSPAGQGSHGWEEPPYWLKGFSNCAYVLGNQRMIEESKIWIEAALASAQPDGWFGPDKGRKGAATRLEGREDLWPNMIMLFCLQDYHSFTADDRVIDLMTNYMKYLATVPEEKFLVGYWPKMRGGDLLSSVYWLYNRTGDPSLLDLAKKVHRRTAKWQDDVINWHNVNMAQGFGEPATYHMQSKDPSHLLAAERNWQKIRNLYGQVPGGMFGGDENCRPGYTGPRQAIETCGIAEKMLSDEMLLRFTGDAKWADRCEDVAFNSLPAAFTPDYKALHYLTAPNMTLCDSRSKSPGLQNGGPMLHFDPHNHRCCQHNAPHAWPYYTQNLWLATPDNGLAAVLYAPSKVTAKVGDGAEVTITQDTRYPFEQTINFTITAPAPVRFPLYLRIPQWAKKIALAINNKPTSIKAHPRSYIMIHRKWSDRDTVTLDLEMPITVTKWTKNNNSVSINRGPLTYSLKIAENYVRKGGTDAWPAWEIHPASPWNYALLLDEADPAASLEFQQKDWPADDQPFEANAAPVTIRARAKKIPEWKMDRLGLVGKLQPSPAISTQPTETVTLIPMGAARLRISAFPTVGTGPDAHKWQAPPERAKPLPTKVSHCWGSDTPNALSDKLLPKNSNDHAIPRLTWWNHKGTTEWAQYDFEKPRKISSVDVYWFDDTGRGGCRVPASWRLLYEDAGQFKPVPNPTNFAVAKDKFNKVAFDPVETKAVRIEIQLQQDFSGGILEWRINPK